MPLPIDNFNLIIKYFSASEDLPKVRSDIEKFLNAYEERNLVQFLQDIYETPLDDNLIIDLLLALNVPLDQWILYLSNPMSLHGFLIELSKNALGISTQLPWLLDRIESKPFNKKLNKLFKVLFPILVILIFPLFFFGPEVLLLFNTLLQTANIIPLAGIGCALSILGVSLYFNHSDLRTPKDKVRVDYYFLLASNALNIAGKVLLMFSKASLVTVAQYLFIASALVIVFNQLFHLQSLYRKKRELGNCEPSSHILIYQSYARLHFECLKQRNDVLISIASAVLVAALVFACLIFPPGFVFTVAISASTCFVYLLELAALKLNEKIMTSYLHTNLEEIAKWRIEEEDNADKERDTGEPAPEPDVQMTMRLQKMCSVSNFNSEPQSLKREPTFRQLEYKNDLPFSYITNSQSSLSGLKQKVQSSTTASLLSVPDEKQRKEETLHRFFKYYCGEDVQAAANPSLKSSSL